MFRFINVAHRAVARGEIGKSVGHSENYGNNSIIKF
jgi:hypothetical protein